MTGKIVTGIIFLAGVINAYPLVGVLSAERLRALYGVSVQDPNLLILLRYRAVLIGLLGGFVLASAFIPAWRTAALSVLLVSALSFVALAWLQGEFNAAIRKVVVVDIVQSVVLIPVLVYALIRPD